MANKIDFQIDFQEEGQKPSLDFQLDFKPDDEDDGGFMGSLKGAGEAALQLASGISAIPAGLAGIAATPFMGPADAGGLTKDLMDKFTYQPRSEEGKKAAGWVGEKLHDAAQGIGKAATWGPAADRLYGPEDENKKELRQTIIGESALNLIPVQIAGKMVGSGGRARPRQAARVPPVEAPKVDFVPEQMELPLETTSQQVAEMRGAEVGQPDLFGPTNIPKVPEIAPPIGEQVALRRAQEAEAWRGAEQEQLLTPDNQGAAANPYEAQQGSWRVDENGIPIRADLSMEAQNMQNPLQRNLWGDELDPVQNPVGQAARLDDRPGMQQGERSLTDAMDQVRENQPPWESIVDDQFPNRALESNQLDGAVAEANSPFPAPMNEGMMRGQRGAINLAMFDGPARIIKEKVLKNGMKFILKGGDETPAITLQRPDGSEAASVIFERKMDFGESMLEWAESAKTWVDPELRGQGVAQALYQWFAKQGNDIKPSGNRTTAGEKMWDNFERNGLSEGGLIRSQRGAIDMNAVSDGVKKLFGMGKESPEVVKAMEGHQRELKKAAISKIPGLDPYRPIVSTPEAVIGLAPDAKDLGPVQNFNARTWRPGIRVNRIATNNPLLNYAGEAIAKTWTAAENLSRQYITNSKDGAGPMYQKLKAEERAEVHQLLAAGDKRQARFTPEQLSKHGFSQEQINFVNRVYAMEDAKIKIWNEKRAEVGLPPVRYRPGHFPGNFKGDYITLAYDSKGSVIGLIGTDTSHGNKSVQAQIKKQFPDVSFSRTERKKLGGHGPRSHHFNGVMDLLNILAENDPRVKQIMDVVRETSGVKADSVFGADVHALDKKGIWGNEGNKPWETNPAKAADEAFKAYFEYWEEGMISHLNMPVEVNLKALNMNPALNHMPRAKAYVDDYVKMMTGRGTGEFGHALNTILDTPGKLMGLGPSVPRAAVNQFTKRMGQLTQGFANLPYTAMQFMQIPQTAWPKMQMAARAAGKHEGSVAAAQAAAAADGIKLMHHRLLDGKVDAESKAMFDYAEERGLLKFSEFDDVHQITQGKASRTADQLIDINRQIAEQSTRPFVFFTFVRLLNDSRLPKNEVFDTAYNLTQDSMVDYSSRERAPMFQKLGVTGQLAGNLQQFSLSYLDQMGQWVKSAAKGNPGPLMLGTAAMLTYSGLQGVPFYTAADEMVRDITDKFFGKREGIADVVLRNAPEWAKTDAVQYGLLSSQSGMNISGRLGMADVLPDSPIDAVSPYAETMGRMGESLYDLAKYRDKQGLKNVARQFAPSSVRGIVENELLTEHNVKQGDTVYPNMTVNKRGQYDYPRTDFDMKARMGGLTSLEESKNKQKLFRGNETNKADDERLSAMSQKASRAFAQQGKKYLQSSDFARLREDYVARRGDPDVLVREMIQAEEQRLLTSKQRAVGDPQTIRALKKWQILNQ